MFYHVKDLQFNAKVSRPDPDLPSLYQNNLVAQTANWRPHSDILDNH